MIWLSVRCLMVLGSRLTSRSFFWVLSGEVSVAGGGGVDGVGGLTGTGATRGGKGVVGISLLIGAPELTATIEGVDTVLCEPKKTLIFLNKEELG